MPMRTLLLTAAIALLAAGAVQAQPGAKAYAPEDLTRLTQPEQIRVLEKQFAELSGGRQLPEDQLEFYLAQISQGWTYAQITEDMTQSLRDRADGNTFQGVPPSGPIGGPIGRPPVTGQAIRCESINSRYTECASGFRHPAQLLRSISRTACVEGRTWGHRPGMIWVSGGCRGEFAEARQTGGQLAEVRCESVRGYRECNVPFRGPAALLRQTQQSSLCVEGRTWGQRPGVIWVDRGCGGFFSEGYRSSGGFYDPGQYDEYTVDCQSLGSAYTLCSWNQSNGAPVLIEQYSFKPCVEGITWGYTPRRGLWVDAGCRARFGSTGIR
jgi:hypothetical protein